MAVCLDYQSVYCDRRRVVVSARLQVIAAVLLLAALGLRVWMRLETTRLGYELGEARQRAITYDMERRELELQRSILLHPQRLSKLGRERLGLRPASPNQVVRVDW